MPVDDRKEDYFGLQKPFWNYTETLQENKITLIIFSHCLNTSHTQKICHLPFQSHMHSLVVSNWHLSLALETNALLSSGWGPVWRNYFQCSLHTLGDNALQNTHWKCLPPLPIHLAYRLVFGLLLQTDNLNNVWIVDFLMWVPKSIGFV